MTFPNLPRLVPDILFLTRRPDSPFSSLRPKTSCEPSSLLALSRTCLITIQFATRYFLRLLFPSLAFDLARLPIHHKIVPPPTMPASYALPLTVLYPLSLCSGDMLSTNLPFFCCFQFRTVIRTSVSTAFRNVTTLGPAI